MAQNMYYNQIDNQSEDIDYEGSIDEDTTRTMKIDHNRIRKSTSEPPLECKVLIDRLKKCTRMQLLEELSKISNWTFGKCELGHWKEVLAIFDGILEEAAESECGNPWTLKCDSYEPTNRKLLLGILHFTTLLIEHSFSRHTYKSMDKLLALLAASDMSVVLAVLNLLYMFSKRSNFITRMQCELRASLVSRLHHLAESWGGKENGFGLADCCNISKQMPPSATTLHFEFHNDNSNAEKETPTKDANRDKEGNKGTEAKSKQAMTYIHVEHVDQLRKSPGEIMKGLLSIYKIPPEKEMLLFTHVRLAYHFSSYRNRILCVQARLQALSVLVYANALQDSAHMLLYNGLLEELVELIELRIPHLVEIRSAALRTLTSIIHLDRNPHFPKKPGSRLNNIIDVTGASQYHGFLPVLVRNCITSLTSQTEKSQTDEPEDPTKLMDFIPEDLGLNPHFFDMKFRFPLPLATALFSFLYHLASYESGGDALVSCGMMESLLQVINWHGVELEHITFVTRAVRVIDLITNVDMQAFYTHGGLQSFINRLEVEVNLCLSEHPYVFKQLTTDSEGAASSLGNAEDLEDDSPTLEFQYIAENAGKTCLAQRTALIKSMLNFLKKALQDSTFAEHIRHLMEGSLPTSLKHMISNAEYYGPSLFLLATDVVTVYVYQEPSLLSTIQDNGLTDVVLQALLVKDVPATREVLASLPNVFSALCLNSRGLRSFVRCKPFERLFKVLLSPTYLSAMRRRRSSDPLGDAASNLGNATDELMRHQPSLKVDATAAIIKLLNELCQLGTDPKYICWRPNSKSEASPVISSRANANPTDGNSSDEEDDDEEDASTSSQNAQTDTQESQTINSERQPIALTEYILNITKFVDAILSNNSTDDHCREFVAQNGLVPLLRILGLPNLPVDCPITNSAQAVASVCKSILNLAHESRVLEEGLSQLNEVLERLKPLYLRTDVPGGSKLLHELANAPHLETAFSTASATPLLHAMSAAHGYVLMFVHVCRTGQNDIRTLSLQHWGSDEGLAVLKGLSELYTSLVWESTLLLALCSDDVIQSDCDFGKEDMEKLNAATSESKDIKEGDNVASAMEALTTNPTASTSSMDVDAETASGNKPTPQQLKYIKPLLGASSRLGRALAELFGLLVKLCVGSPIRQRRGQNMITSPAPAIAYARSVAAELNNLLANGLDYECLPPSTVPKFRLTFLICSVGFTSPMLFDEKKYPYHLMLRKFVTLGGQVTFFNAFKWALSAGGTIELNRAIESPNLPEGTGEFLEAWLTLLEKMVNPKTILESPHVISTRSVSSKHLAFDPVKYLMQIHNDAFIAVMYLWGKKPLPNYGVRMSDSILTILGHILRGEKIIREKLNRTDDNKRETAVAATTATTTAGASTSTSSPRTSTPLGFRPASEMLSELNALLDMGFSRDPAMDALIRTLNLEQATDYLLSNPQSSRATPQSEGDMSEDDQFSLAIALSLGDQSGTAKKREVPKDPKPIPTELIDEFTKDALQICLDLIEQIPDTIFRVCDLLVTIMKRNGPAFRKSTLELLLLEIHQNARLLLEQSASIEYEPNGDCVQSRRLGYLTHLYTLFFEVPSYLEMRGPCGLAFYACELVPQFILLLVHFAEENINEYRDGFVPKWLTPVLLLLDALGKVSVSSQRKREMHMVTKRTWKWYDIVSGKWTKYSESNNKIINDAYWNGEQTVRITCGRRRYTISFTAMQQINEESSNNRPISMTPINFAKLIENKSTKTNYEEMENEKVQLSEKEEKRCIALPVYTPEEADSIVKCCVVLMKQEIDRDTLHAIMRLCLRLTQDFRVAKVFVNEGGISCLLKYKEKYAFSGFKTIATLLIRHALESNAVLSYAMEKVIRGRTLTTLPPSYKELMYLLRSMSSCVTRDSEIFLQVAKNTLRIDTNNRRNPLDEDNDSRLPLCTDSSTKSEAPNILDEESKKAIYTLLNALKRPIADDPLAVPEKSKKQTHVPSLATVPISPPSVFMSSSMCQRASDLLSSNVATNDILNLDSQDERPKLMRTPSEISIEIKMDPATSHRTILSKPNILKILADAVVSYAGVARLITEYVYEGRHCFEDSREGISCLAFLFDKILPMDEMLSDRECSNMCRTLIAGIASCNYSPEAQATLVTEVKAALVRALLMPESFEKHNRIQHITGIILSMIEQCPPVQQVRIYKSQTFNANVNNIARLMLKKGIFNDLARVPHCLDMSSPNFSATINTALKPLECLSKIVNQPITGSLTGHNNKKKESSNNAANAGSSSDIRNDQTFELDPVDNIENIAGAAANLDDDVNQHTQLPHNVLDELMDQILVDRDQNGGTGTMDIDDESNLVVFNAERAVNEELMSTESEDSGDSADSGESDEDVEEEDSNAENALDEEVDNNDDDDDDNEEEEDDDDVDDVEEEEDDADPEFNDNEDYDRDEDVVMLQYADHDSDTLPRMIRWTEDALPIIDNAGNSNDQSAPTMHPLLVSRHSHESAVANMARVQRTNRTRRYQYLQLNTRSNNPPVILQRLLGPTQNIHIGSSNIFHSTPLNVTRDSARVVVMDNFGIFPSVEEQIDFVDQNGYYFGPSMLTTANHMPVVLHWWKEESRFVDGESVHDVVTTVSNKLIPNLVKHRRAAIAELKKKQESDTTKIPVPKSEEPKSSEPTETESSENLGNTSQTNPSDSDVSSILEEDTPRPPDVATFVSTVIRVPSQPDVRQPLQMDPQNETVLENDSFTQRDLLSFENTLVSNSSQPETTTSTVAATETEPATTSVTSSQSTEPSTSASQEIATSFELESTLVNDNNSGTTSASNTNQDAEEIPEGVDPSFLEALPLEMRREVLEQHRMLRLQQRISTTAAAGDATSSGLNTEVSPEFLAALPPSLQEEVLTQQRLEQQRQAAARANPDEPVDAASFFETLQPSLRTMILSDMEDSQMSALPPDLAAEAQTLRRDWEARNRQLQAQERFLEANLTTIIRQTGRGRMGTRFNPNHLLPQWAQNRSEFGSSNSNTNIKIRGRQLLDHEALSCLLVLLFVDDPKLNTGRLHRVLRNLCYHVATRDWVIRALLSIIEKSVHVKPDDTLNKPKKAPKPGPLSSKLTTDNKSMGNGANWLNIRMEAALGCHANVFIVNRVSGKRTEKNASNATVSIHPQAAPIVCKNALDIFTSLARTFHTFMLPLKPKNKIQAGKSKPESTDFWDLLLKLDAVSNKKGKALTKVHSSYNIGSDSEMVVQSFEQSAFGQLLGMLNANVITSSIQLTDKLLRLLSVISSGMPELYKNEPNNSAKQIANSYQSIAAPESALNLAVNVLTYKSCSEEGLEEATSLLLNLSTCSLEMSRSILNLLLQGAKRIGEIVQGQIQAMLVELQTTHKKAHKAKDDISPSTSKGVLNNRFTNEQVVITAPSKVKTSCDLQLPSMIPLTSKSSSQVFFLRVLRVIVQIREAIYTKKGPEAGICLSPLLLSDQLEDLEGLWQTLSHCLLELEHTPDHHAVLVLQPAVEAFFLVHSPPQEVGTSAGSSSGTNTANADAKTTAQEVTAEKEDTLLAPLPFSDMPGSSDSSGGRSSVPPEHQKFLTFAEKHRTVLNQILRQTTAHLADGPFSVLVDHTRVLDFDIKRRYFRTELDRLDQNIRREETAVHVRREHIFEDSFRELYRRTPEEWKNRFYIVFEDEEGQDAGGLLREWYVIISRDIFNPMYALFTVSPGDRVTYMINSASHYNPNHLCYYKFVGRVIAKAIYDNKLLECYFTRSFYKHILGIPVKYTDMESEDYTFYRGLVYLMENNINNFDCDLTFSTEINEFGVTETRDLIPNGRNVPVTEENKMEYVRRSCQMKMTGAIRQQLTAFLEGFYDIIPKRLISIFNEQELELLISGLPNVDIEDLKANTEYHKYQANSLQIQWFWRALRSFDQADRAKFLQFVTGTSKVPLQGFGALEGMNGVQRFQIHRDDRSTDRLPSAHTCFNQLDLPVYETYDKLRSYLLKAIHECSEGFGFA